MKREFALIDARERELLRWQLTDRAQVLLDEAECDAVELAAIEAALERMRAGTYGTCADCFAALPWARLHASPEALRCVDCEAVSEARPAPHASL